MDTSPTPGYRFKADTLYIFTRDSIRLIKTWPTLEAVRKGNANSEWRKFTPEFRLVEPYRKRVKKPAKPSDGNQSEFDFFAGVPKNPVPKSQSQVLREQRKRAFTSFRFSLPKEAASRVEKFNCGQWRLLNLFRANLGAMDVCASNPALVFGLAHCSRIAENAATIPVTLASEIVLRKQRELLDLLQFPTSSSVAKTLAKLEPESVCVNTLRSLRGLISDEKQMKRLSHLPRINVGVIELMGMEQWSPALSMSLLEQVARRKQEKHWGATAKKIGELAFMVDYLEGLRMPLKFLSIEQIDTRIAEIIPDFLKVQRAVKGGGPFPAPPLPGLDGIVPVRQERDLVVEGRVQRNCIASYATRIRERRCYIYRVERPERATLCVRRRPDGSWFRSELLLSCNRMPSCATTEYVDDWIASHSLGV